MDVAQLGLARTVVTLIAPARTPVSDEVLGGGDDVG